MSRGMWRIHMGHDANVPWTMTSHIGISGMSHMNESYHIWMRRAMWRIHMGHDANVPWTMTSHIGISGMSHMNESLHIWMSRCDSFIWDMMQTYHRQCPRTVGATTKEIKILRPNLEILRYRDVECNVFAVVEWVMSYVSESCHIFQQKRARILLPIISAPSSAGMCDMAHSYATGVWCIYIYIYIIGLLCKRAL